MTVCKCACARACVLAHVTRRRVQLARAHLFRGDGTRQEGWGRVWERGMDGERIRNKVFFSFFPSFSLSLSLCVSLSHSLSLSLSLCLSASPSLSLPSSSPSLWGWRACGGNESLTRPNKSVNSDGLLPSTRVIVYQQSKFLFFKKKRKEKKRKEKKRKEKKVIVKRRKIELQVQKSSQ